MFVNKVIERNSKLIDAIIQLHENGEILPDSYVVDMDTLVDNAKRILAEAKKYDMKLYFMLKQLGRNPYVAQELVKLGYDGAVVVDYKEAEVMMNHNIPICNVGHLVQPPHAKIQELVDYGCEYFTVYSLEKIRDINECSKKSNHIQKLLLRVIGENDLIYSGQTAGFKLEELDEVIEEIKKLKNVSIQGVTSFPCFLYDETKNENEPTNNLTSVLEAVDILKKHDIHVENINTPSTTCVATLNEMVKYGATSGEPGHGLTGTTPLHASTSDYEIPSVIYLSEVSHNLDGLSYCFGGGYYRRSHVENALVTKNLEPCKVITPTLDSIDYHFGLSKQFHVGEPVIMAFRFQIFVTRSDVVLVEGIQSNHAKVIGRFSSLGDKR